MESKLGGITAMNNGVFLHSVYRRAALSFFVLTVILLIMVAYYVLPQAIVVITPQESSVVRSHLFTVFTDSKEVTGPQDLLGGFTRIEIIQEKTFPATGVKTTAENIKGQIVIKNNYTKDQPLVETTRFLTSGGLLLRLADGVVVPSGGEVIGEVYLDEQTEAVSSIPKGRLTIPGLWEGLRDKIYGEVPEPLVGPTFELTAVSEEDLNFGKEELRASIQDTARGVLKQRFSLSQQFLPEVAGEMELAVLRIVDEEWQSTSDVDEVADNFKLTGRLIVEGVFYRVEEAAEKMESAITNSLSEDKKIVHDINRDNIVVSINTSDPSKNTGEVLISWHGKSISGEIEEVVTEEFLAGLRPEEAIDKLEGMEEIGSARIELTPFWVSKIPKNNIDIIIVQD